MIIARPAQAAVTLYVSPHGQDGWSGRLPEPNAAKTDGPLATLGAARDHLRQSRKSPSDLATVVVRGGTYRLTEPLVLTSQDSGAPNAPVTYEAYTNEVPIVSGGQTITGWHEAGNGLWAASVPGVQAGNWEFRQLFVGGVRRPRTHLPVDGGFLKIADAVPSSDPKRGADRFQYTPGDILPTWRSLSDVEVLCYHVWSMSRLRIETVDDTTHLVKFTGLTCSPDNWASLAKGGRYRIENVFEALPQEPGAWYLDRAAGIVYYHPLPGEEINTFAPVVPRLAHLVEFQGVPEAYAYVSNIHLRGLSFQDADWALAREGYSCPQAEIALSGVIWGQGMRDCTIEDCEITHTGTYAIELGRGCQRNSILRCTLHDLGAGGVKIGEAGIRANADDIASGNTVKDCRIYDGGQVHPAAVGVWIGQSPGNQIVHNDIHDLYYTGVSVGWTWGYGPSLAQRNIIGYNHIWNIGRGLLSDMGGVYTLGDETGGQVVHNVIHDVQTATYGGWGIYPDEGTTGMLIADNVVYRTKTGGFHQHYGKNNLVQNNIFALSKEAQLQRTRAEDHLSFTFTRNIVFFDNGDLLNGNWHDGQFAMDNNLYWDTSGKPLTFEGKPLADWQKTGHDVHSLIADPGFVNSQGGNFTLRSGSPALALGFQPIELTGVGAQKAK